MTAVLSCFHVPMVESTSDTMEENLDVTSPNMIMETYRSFQTVKHELKAQRLTSVQMCYHPEPKHAKVDPARCENLQEGLHTSEDMKQKRKLQVQSEYVVCDISSSVSPTKRKFHEIVSTEAENSRSS